MEWIHVTLDWDTWRASCSGWT